MPCLTRESLKGNCSVDRGFESHEQSWEPFYKRFKREIELFAQSKSTGTSTGTYFFRDHEFFYSIFYRPQCLHNIRLEGGGKGVSQI